METLTKCDLCGSTSLFPFEDSILRCNCGYVFNSPRMTFREIEQFYSKPNQYQDWLEHEVGRDILAQRRLKMVRRLKSNGRLLDVGCGTGQFLFFAKDYFQVMGTEVSDSAIKIAHDKYGLDIIKGEIEHLDFTSRFDVITITHILEHVHYPTAFMNKCKRLLAEDGVIIICVPNDVTSLKNVARIILSRLKIGKFKYLGKHGIPKITNADGSINEIHLSHFTPSVLNKWLTSIGFEIIQDTLDPYYCSIGKGKLVNDIYYFSCLTFKKIFRINIYETMCVVIK